MTKTNQHEFIQGIKAGVPVAVGYIPIAVAFGLLAKSLAIPYAVSVLMSLLIYAGASQFIGVNLMAIGASFSEIVIATFLLNLRHFLMTGALSQRLEAAASKRWRAVIVFGVTDETFSVSALNQVATLPRYYVLGLNSIAFAAWNGGTWLGLFVAGGLPDVVKDSMGIALYAMFIGLLVPHVKTSRPALVVSVLAVCINCLYYYGSAQFGFSSGWGIIAATVLSAAAGAFVFTKGEKEA